MSSISKIQTDSWHLIVYNSMADYFVEIVESEGHELSPELKDAYLAVLEDIERRGPEDHRAFELVLRENIVEEQ